jgi:hypothetical protein
MAARTNEDATTIANTGLYTDAAGDDRAVKTATNIIINLGDGAGIPPGNGGNITGGTTVPRFYTSYTIIQATFRVVVTAGQGATLTLGGNYFIYGSTQYDLSSLTVYVSYTYNCTSLDPTNLITVDNNGTFGTGTAQNRAASPYTTGFTYTTIANNRPPDGQYSIVKNTSHTQYVGATPANSDRVFGVFDVFGDHTGQTTGASNPARGNNISGGYMVIVNASFVPSAVFSYSMSGLLPNTMYTLRFWIRNVCGRCSADPVNNMATFPAAPGVLPNLIFSVNGYDYMTTGKIPFDQLWNQRSLTFSTGASTTANVVIRNNAPGGGGNDWAIDDISLNQCLVVLPVSMNVFSGSYFSGNSHLQWEVVADNSVKQYNVEYSSNGTDFEKAGYVVSSQKGGKYTYNHYTTIVGKIYYRLRIEDKDGRSGYSKVIVLRDENRQASSLKISPNPSTDVLNFILVSQKKQTAFIQVINAAGKIVNQFNKQLNTGSNSFSNSPGSRLIPDIYVVHVTLEDGTVLNERVMVSGK